MILKDGKFWQDGKVVPMEHGNKDQIALLSDVNIAIDEGIPPQVIIQKKVSLEFMCPACKTYCSFDDIEPMDENDDIEVVLPGETDTCHNCKIPFVVCYSDSEGIMIKILTKKKKKK